MKVFKKFWTSLFVLFFAVNISIASVGATVVDSVDTQVKDEILIGEGDAEDRGPTFSYVWKVSKTEHVYSGWGSWRNGPTGKGPATMSINESSTLNRSFTASITSGGFPAGKGNVGASIGVTIGESKSYGTTYNISIAAGERKQIIYRPKHKTMKVTQTRYKVNNENGQMTAIDSDVCFVDIFDSWDYSWQYQ